MREPERNRTLGMKPPISLRLFYVPMMKNASFEFD